jgi:coproporphyrinogen III oxidase-like Fe-S oxidoreductase
MALGLRRVDGISRAAFAHEFGADPVARFGATLRESADAGLLEIGAGRLRLTARGRLLASEVLIGLLPGPADAASA